MIMKKILLVLALVAIVFASGCVGGTETADNGNGNGLAEDQAQIQQHSGECRWDTDCQLANCRDTAGEVNCMSSVQILTLMKCQDLGGVVTVKDYQLCGCVEGICKTK